MDEVVLSLDPAMIDSMRREADDHGFDEVDEYVQWVLERRDTVLTEYGAWENPPGVTEDEPAESDDDWEWESPGGADDGTDEEEAGLPDDDGADDDDVAAALEDLELDDEN